MRTLHFLPLIPLAACTALAPEAQDCSGEIQVNVFADGETPIGSDGVTLTGTATHTGGLAIRSLVVGGVPATNGGNNYLTWSATLLLSQLRALDVDGDGSVPVPVTARDACDAVLSDTDAVTLTLDANPEVKVERLALTVSVPGGGDWIPADGTHPALLSLTANPAAAGAVVDLDVSAGTLLGAPVTLAGDGTADATATALLTVDTAVTVVVIATAEGVATSATLVAAGAPVLSPDSGSLLPGAQIAVEVWSDGEIASCAAYAEDSDVIAVTGASGSLYGGGEVSDTDADGRWELTLAASDTAPAGATVDLRCCDTYDQCGAGTYTVAAVAE
jgi:hypothetical protein